MPAPTSTIGPRGGAQELRVTSPIPTLVTLVIEVGGTAGYLVTENAEQVTENNEAATENAPP